MERYDWWLENITFGAPLAAYRVMDVVADEMGEAAACGVLVLLAPLIAIGLCLGVFLTVLLMVGCVFWIPVAAIRSAWKMGRN